mmetsp:Transcript_17306/g.34445  ORF Transcript_17306/g.34445 Transcript_17306/m.34445 type:complete len:211 (+) Transcript_17306:823-1455(+)
MPRPLAAGPRRRDLRPALLPRGPLGPRLRLQGRERAALERHGGDVRGDPRRTPGAPPGVSLPGLPPGGVTPRQRRHGQHRPDLGRGRHQRHAGGAPGQLRAAGAGVHRGRRGPAGAAALSYADGQPAHLRHRQAAQRLRGLRPVPRGPAAHQVHLQPGGALAPRVRRAGAAGGGGRRRDRRHVGRWAGCRRGRRARFPRGRDGAPRVRPQ